MTPFNPTEHLTFWDGTTRIVVHVQNDRKCFRWQLEVNGSSSDPTSDYSGLLVHQGYAYATAYWEGTLPHEIPFKITPAIAAELI